MSLQGKLVKFIVPLLIILVGFLGFRMLVMSREAPHKEVRENPGALVEVFEVQRRDHRVEVLGTGTVQARSEVSITPQVSGRVVEMAPEFIAGGFFRKGQLLFGIEEIDYRLAVDRARAALTRAQVELATVQSQARIARIEWDRLALDGGGEPNPLVLFEPQLKNARANIASAEAALKQAELDLQRTRIYAPFNCRVRSEQVDPGQYLRAGTGVAMLAGTDRAEVVVPLPVDELGWLQVPGPGNGAKGAAATIRFRSGDKLHEWPGRLVRSLGEVDSRGRMARLVVGVDDPYGFEARTKQGRPALEVGLFVEVALHGEVLSQVVTIPRRALRDQQTVWIADEQNQLQIHSVSILREEKDEVLVKNGLPQGARVVLTYLSGAAEGMKLRPRLAGAGQ